MSKEAEYHKKTILQVVPALVSGGVERGTIEIGKYLVEQGYNSIVISSGGPLVKSLVEAGSIHVEMDVASKNPFTIWRNASKIAEIIKKYNVDIIHARSRAPAWSCALAARSTNTKFITTFHGIYNFNNLIKKYYNSIMTQGNLVIAVSNFVRDHIVKNYMIDPNKIRVIHRGANHLDFTKDKLDPQTLEAFREKYKVPQGVPVLLLPGRFTNWKGQMFLAEALSKIKDENFYCIMAGDLSKHPAFIQKLQAKICQNKMQAKVQIFGNEPDVRSLYGIADIVISASIEPEAFGRTIIEAQSMEKIVIATGIGGAAETIEHGISGFHVAPGDVDQFAKQIKECIAMIGSDQEKMITEKARNAVIENFSLNKMLTSVIKVYEEILTTKNQ